jgi:hypothetical protein
MGFPPSKEFPIRNCGMKLVSIRNGHLNFLCGYFWIMLWIIAVSTIIMLSIFMPNPYITRFFEFPFFLKKKNLSNSICLEYLIFFWLRCAKENASRRQQWYCWIWRFEDDNTPKQLWLEISFFSPSVHLDHIFVAENPRSLASHLPTPVQGAPPIQTVLFHGYCFTSFYDFFHGLCPHFFFLHRGSLGQGRGFLEVGSHHDVDPPPRLAFRRSPLSLVSVTASACSDAKHYAMTLTSNFCTRVFSK